LQYLKQNFVNQSASYRHKSLKEIFDRIELPLTSYYASDTTDGRELCTGIDIVFSYSDSKKVKTVPVSKSPVLIIVFEKPFPLKQIDDLTRKYHGRWKKEQTVLFENQAISDILLTETNSQ